MKQRDQSPYTPKVAAYMKSEAWAAKRMQRLQVDKFRCRICGVYMSSGAGHVLQVHHLAGAYDDIPNETPADLLTLCEQCHADLHEILEKRRREWKKKKVK